MIFPPVARQDVLIKRQRNARLQLFELGQQGADAEIVGTCRGSSLNQICMPPSAHRAIPGAL